MKTRFFKPVVGIAACIAAAGLAYAAVTFDAETGEGFVGKGDVQLVFGWNNKQLQDNAHLVQFRYHSEEVVTWWCVDPDPDTPPNPAAQKRESNQSISGVPNGDPRQKQGQKQFTGFDLLGWDGDPEVSEEGEALYSCTPNRVLDEESIEITSLGGGLQVSIDGDDWKDLE